ncbi:DNA repair protein RecO [bacterium]|nr:DNA repair protein RecO [bacterium]
MSYFKTKAIILKSQSLSEDSKIISLLTVKWGRIFAVAKGSKRLNNKFGFSLEKFTYLETQFYQKTDQNLYTLIQAKLISSHSPIREDLKKTATALCLVEILDLALVGKEPDLRIFLLTLKSLQLISKGYHSLYIYAFVLKLFSFLGLRIHLKNCLVCKIPIEKADCGLKPSLAQTVREQSSLTGLTKVKLSFLEGGVVCFDCSQGMKTMDLSFQMLELLRNLLYLKLNEVSKLSLSKETLKNLKGIILDNYLAYYLPSPLKSLKFYESMIEE